MASSACSMNRELPLTVCEIVSRSMREQADSSWKNT